VPPDNNLEETSMGGRTSTKELHSWQQRVETFNTSGLTRKAFAKQAGISVCRLDYWRRKVSRRGTSPEQSPAQQWMTVKVTDESANNVSSIDLWIGSVRIEVKPGFDENHLAAIIRAAGSAC
jgi:hypothetical protein